MIKAQCSCAFLLRVATVVFFTSVSTHAKGAWKVFWSDEFDSTALNEKNWSVRVANPGWVNGEQEQYTAGHDQAGSNIFVKNGTLILETRKSGSSITSGRIEGGGLQSFTYGRMEARMRLPITQGMWPAFWMLGTSGGWPQCGELDIMEGKGRLPNFTSGSYHFTGYNAYNQYTLPSNTNVHDYFHIYAAEWSTDSIRWYCDTVCFGTITKADQPSLPWDKPFYFILNLAVGGNFDGNSDNTTIFPDSLIVDYVRVYHWDSTASSVALLPPRNMIRNGANLRNNAGSFSVTLPSEQAYSVTLFSLDGKPVLSHNGKARDFTLSTAALSPGVYAASVRGNFGTLAARVVVER